MALDYGYIVNIQSNGTSDPSSVPLNQWQRKLSGQTGFEDLDGETNTTYKVTAADQSSQIRLKQTFNGAPAYSNALTVTSSTPPALMPDPLKLEKIKEQQGYYWSSVIAANGVWMICGANDATPGATHNKTQRRSPEQPWFSTSPGTADSYTMCYAGSNKWLTEGVDKQIYRSTDNGKNFQAFNPSGLSVGFEQYYFFKNKGETNTVIASARFGSSIWRSTNSGTSFTQVFSGSYCEYGYGRGGKWVGSNFITSYDRDIVTSTNDGQTWTNRTSVIAQTLGGNGSEQLYAGKPYVNKEGHMYIWAKIATTGYTGESFVLKSTNGGSSWTKLKNDTRNWPTSYRGNVYGNDAGLLVIGPIYSGSHISWWSADDGQTWKKATMGTSISSASNNWNYDADFDDSMYIECSGKTGTAPLFSINLT